MKKGIHPESYRMVAFKDMSNGHTFLTRSTVQTRENLELTELVPAGKDWKSAIPPIRSTPARLNWLTLLVALTNS
jgi:hypothetical protein